MDADRLALDADAETHAEAAHLFRAMLLPRLLLLCGAVAALAWLRLLPWLAAGVSAAIAAGLTAIAGLNECHARQRVRAELRRLTARPPQSDSRPTAR